MNLRRRIGRRRIGGFGFLSNFLDFSIKKGEKRWSARYVEVFSLSSKKF